MHESTLDSIKREARCCEHSGGAASAWRVRLANRNISSSDAGMTFVDEAVTAIFDGFVLT